MGSIKAVNNDDGFVVGAGLSLRKRVSFLYVILCTSINYPGGLGFNGAKSDGTLALVDAHEETPFSFSLSLSGDLVILVELDDCVSSEKRTEKTRRIGTDGCVCVAVGSTQVFSTFFPFCGSHDALLVGKEQ